MRRDICYFYPTNIEAVYSAYCAAIKQQFKKDAEGTPYHSLIFGLNFSFKYNMNGGGCNVHFMTYEGGTAVDVHYTIAQAMGARCEAHAKDLTACAERILGIASQRIDNIDLNAFQAGKEQYIQPQFQQPVQQPLPQPEPSVARFCPQCGKEFPHDAIFCPQCGTKRP